MSDDDSVGFTRRRVLGLACGLGITGATAGAGTMAYFSDSEASSGNVINAGTLELEVSDGDEWFGDGVSGTWTLDDAKPGDEVQADATLANAGTLSADHVEFDFSYEEKDGDGPGGDDMDAWPNSADGMAKQIEVVEFSYDGSIVSLNDGNENGRVDLDDLANHNDDVLDSLSPPPEAKGGTKSLAMRLKFANDPLNNRYQGDSVEFTVTMSLHQDSSQDA